jgi:hypothetical protein
MNKSLTLAVVLLVLFALAVQGEAKFYWKRYKHLDNTQSIVPDYNKPALEYAADTCNITHFEFQSNYSLGKQDELNRTFTKLG